SFFFSSRRRHTRFSRDWSSDVCSSDLLLAFVFVSSLGWEAVANMFGLYFTKAVGSPVHWYGTVISASTLVSMATYGLLVDFGQRSEERRVGNERRSRWRLDHLNRQRGI